MMPRIRIRQERPRSTRAPYSLRTWELFVYNQGTGKHEYYGFAWSFLEAISIAHIIYSRTMLPHGEFVQEVTA